MACAVSVALVASVAAQDALSKRVSLDLKAMAPADAFGTLASSVGLKAVVDSAVTAPVDIVVRNVSARTALTTMCESIGCEWSVANGTLSIKPARAGEPRGGRGFVARDKSGNVVSSSFEASSLKAMMSQPLPADMKFENAPLAKVSERLSQALGIQLLLTSDDPGLQSVTVDFSQKSLQEGLKALVDAGGGQYRGSMMLRLWVGTKDQSPTIVIGIGRPSRPRK
jgi:type II secretory pathway component GspD/PulD (secretin)